MKIDIQATVDLIMNSEPHTVHEPVVITLDPEITGDILRKTRHEKVLMLPVSEAGEEDKTSGLQRRRFIITCLRREKFFI